jgi:uncharacterized membrane protein YqjE
MDEPRIDDTALPPVPEAPDFNPLRLLRIMRSAGSALLAQAALHGQLARVEWAQEKARLLRMVLIAALGFACLLCVMLFAGLLLLAVSWDSVYRIPAFVAVIGIYALGVGVAWYQLHGLAALGDQAFAATREEISADLAMLKSRL